MTGPTPGADGWRGLLDGLGGLLGGAGGAAAGGDHAAECRTCPVCTALAVLRGQRPDLSEALADVLSTAATALRGLAQPSAGPASPSAAAPTAAAPTAAAPTGSDRPDPSAVPDPDPEPAPAPAPVQRIEVA